MMPRKEAIRYDIYCAMLGVSLIISVLFNILFIDWYANAENKQSVISALSAELDRVNQFNSEVLSDNDYLNQKLANVEPSMCQHMIYDIPSLDQALNYAVDEIKYEVTNQ